MKLSMNQYVIIFALFASGCNSHNNVEKINLLPIPANQQDEEAINALVVADIIASNHSAYRHYFVDLTMGSLRLLEDKIDLHTFSILPFQNAPLDKDGFCMENCEKIHLSKIVKIDDHNWKIKVSWVAQSQNTGTFEFELKNDQNKLKIVSRRILSIS
jgi:hypothetical protein